MSRRALRETRLIDAVKNIQRHGLGGGMEDGGLVHVIPEALDPAALKVTVQGSPPGARLLLGEIRKDAGPRPDATRINAAIRIFDKMVAGHPAVIREIVLIGHFGDVEIRYDDDVKVFLSKMSHHSRKIRKQLAVDSKGTILFLKTNVEIDGILRDMVCPEALRNLHHTRLWCVAVARLLKTKRPQRRQGWLTG